MTKGFISNYTKAYNYDEPKQETVKPGVFIPDYEIKNNKLIKNNKTNFTKVKE